MIGWIDGGAGASGDMILGALVDAGVPLDVPAAAVDALDLGITLRSESVQRASLGATKVHVDVPETRIVRHLPDIVELLGPLEPAVRMLAAEVFLHLARAEADVHDTTVAEVHFHEVGALDSIADVVGAAAGFVHLGLSELRCSTMSLGSGQARSAHGPMPIPAPAVLELLRGIAPVQTGPAPFESTTPTGAALLRTVVNTWGPMPPMRVDEIGIGAGSKDSPDVANVLRLVLGDAVTPSGGRWHGAASPRT